MLNFHTRRSSFCQLKTSLPLPHLRNFLRQTVVTLPSIAVQLMLSKFEYDGDLNPHFRTGPFELPFTEIQTYWQEPVAPKFVHISSAGVTRLNR